jgi:hypothetical protein
MSDFVGALQLLPYERPAADHNDHDGDDRADDPASPATCPSRRPFALGPDHRRRRRPPGRRPGRRLLRSPLRGRWWGSHLGLHAAWRIFRCGVSAPMKPEVLVVVVVFTVFSLRVPEEASGRARARRKSRALNVSFNGRARPVRGVRGVHRVIHTPRRARCGERRYTQILRLFELWWQRAARVCIGRRKWLGVIELLAMPGLPT